MRVEVVLFAALREALGTSRITVELSEGSTGAELREVLIARFPQQQDLILACRLAQGIEFLQEGTALRDGDEVVLIPPVSGGSEPAAAHLTPDPLDGDELKAAAYARGSGAVTVFEGTVRSPSQGREVRYLEYEAYHHMALSQMVRIVEEARDRWPVTSVFLHHRVGRIEVGEVSVVAVASAPHRAEAFEACRHLIERLKADVPIWKKEVFADGSVWVGAPGECRHEGAENQP